jgi:ribosomal protein S4
MDLYFVPCRWGVVLADPDLLLLCRLYAMGVITTKKSLTQVEALPTSAFCRRRLAVVMVRLKMAETMQEAVTLVEQVGHPVFCTFS